MYLLLAVVNIVKSNPLPLHGRLSCFVDCLKITKQMLFGYFLEKQSTIPFTSFRMVISWYVRCVSRNTCYNCSNMLTNHFAPLSPQGEKPTWPTNFGIEFCKKMKYVLFFSLFYDNHLLLISYFQLLSISICPQTWTASPHQ